MRFLPIYLAFGTLVAPMAAYGQWGYGGVPVNRAATAGESAMRGMSDVVRSAGAANLMNSEAAGRYEDARSKNLDNRLKYTQTYFEMKRYNKEYRDATKAPRPTSEQLFRLAKEATPPKPASHQLDPVSGAIQWPEILKMEDFDSYRETLDALYAERAQAGGAVNLDQYKEIRQNISDLQIELKRRINDMPPQVFSSANAFLKQLEHAAKLAS